jgi:hypothetical protein
VIVLDLAGEGSCNTSSFLKNCPEFSVKLPISGAFLVQ